MGKQFSSDYQPKGRGRSKKTLILEAIKKEALLDLTFDASNDDAEKAVFGFMATAAFNPTPETGPMANTCLSMLMKKGWPDVKAVMPCVEFKFDPNATYAEKADQIITAMSEGHIPPDVASNIITSITALIKIDEVTDLRNDVEEIKNLLGEQNG